MIDIHDGEIVHSMDHFVLDLKTPENTNAYFTIYSLGMMRDVGTGLVALLRIETADGVIDGCYGETIGLAARMQRRLRTKGAKEDGTPVAGMASTPIRATIRRAPTSQQGEHWTVETAEHTVVASWSHPEPAFWLSAPAPEFHATHDYSTAMISYREAELVVDGKTVDGSPFPHEVWEQRLQRPFSSCHAALSEIAIEAS